MMKVQPLMRPSLHDVNEPEPAWLTGPSVTRPAVPTLSRKGTVKAVRAQDRTSVNKVALLGVAALVLHLCFGVLLGVAIEDWTVLDSVYFALVTLTTVGYGDVAPRTQLGRASTAVYIIYGVVMLTWLASTMTTILAERIEAAAAAASNAESVEAAPPRQPSRLARLPFHIQVLLYLSCCLLIGIIFFVAVENMGFIDSLYFCVVTLTTVGYGDMHVMTNGGKVFMILYLATGTVVVAKLVGQSIDRFIERDRRRRQRRILKQRLSERDLATADADASGDLTEAEFIVFQLQRMGIVKRQDLAEVQKQFSRIDKDGDGTITLDEARIIDSDSED